jgi:hypothetical protein
VIQWASACIRSAGGGTRSGTSCARRGHHRLLHVEDMRSLQAVRPAKPAKPPDRLRKSSACSRTEASRGAPAAGEEMLPTSGMSAGVTAVATDEEKTAALKDAHQARLADVRGRHHTQLAAMKQRLPALEAAGAVARRGRCQKASTRKGAPGGHSSCGRAFGKGRGAPVVHGKSASTHRGKPDGGGVMPPVSERTPGGCRGSTGSCGGTKKPMSTVKTVAGTPHSGEAGGRRGHHQRPQEQGAGSAMARGAVTTAPQNTPAEQRAPGEQQAAAGRCEREQIGRGADAAH